MQAYHYNHLRFYDGTISRQIDLEASAVTGHNIYLMPANSTDVKPAIQEGYIPRWNGTEWEQYANDKTVYGYTTNDDGTINYLGSAHTKEELQARNVGIDLLFADTEPVSVDGVYWLSADDSAYIEAKKAHDKAEALAQLDAQYNADKASLLSAYQGAMVYGDEATMEQLKADLAALDDKYDEDYAKIEEGE